MINFADLQKTPQIIILILSLFMLLLNGHIMAFTLIRTRRWEINLIAFLHILLYYIILVALSTFLYEINLGLKPHPLSYYFASLPLWVYQVFLLVGCCCVFLLLYRIRIYKKNTITQASIKESIDNLPAGLCLSLENSFVILSNWQIDRLCHILTGKDLQNGEIFWETLTKGVLKEGNQRWIQGANPIITLENGRTWSFNRNIVEFKGETVIEITAIDTTDLNALRIQLEENNKFLEEMGSRLRKYSMDVKRIKAKEERLATKMHIHDELGYAILATRKLIKKQDLKIEMKLEVGEILDIWRENISVLKGVIESEENTALDSLYSAAEAIGVRIALEGALPEDRFITNLILLVAGECLSNAVRHARATELYIVINKTTEGFSAIFSNNGSLPPAKIVEGGGLVGLREKIEPIGGVMKVTHIPKFILKVNIPKAGRWEQ